MSYVSPFTGDVVQPTDVSFRSFSMSTDVHLAWPINGNADGNYAARIMEVTADLPDLMLYMPPANQTSVGTDALIRNLGSESFTVVDYDGNTIITITAGIAQYIYITNNPDTSGTWGIITFGAGSSSADAATLAGLGLVAITNTLNQSHPTSSISPGYTFAAGDRAQTKIWSGGAGTLTLPLASSLGDNWFTIFKNNGTGTVTIDAAAPDEIDNLLFKSFNPGESAFVICTGAGYVTVGYGQSSTFAFTALEKPVTSGTVILTAVEASNTIQEYVGSLTGNVTVVYPPVVNLYVVSNQVISNGYSLTITTGVPGGTDATVPAGQQATLICDGVSFLNANTVQAGGTSFQLVNGSEANPSLSFGSEPSTGIYRSGTGRFDISVLGTKRFEVNSNGITVAGSGVFSGGIAGGVFS